MSLWSRIANVFRRDRLNRDLDEELESHVAKAIEHGRDPAEAARAFGRAIQHRERSRDLRILPWLDSLRADAVFGWRQLMKRKVVSTAAILSLALAIGACTAAFRLIDALLWRPLPVASPERLYAVAFEGDEAFVFDSCSYPMFRQMRAAVKDEAKLMAVAYAERTDITYASDQEMETALVQDVSGSMFRTLGVGAAAGRVFSDADDAEPGAHPYAVLSYDYWTRRFGQDRKVVGRTFHVDETLYEIIGVSGKGFLGTETGTATDIFVPMAMKDPRTLASPDFFWLRILVQLRPGVSPAPVREKLRATFRAIQIERAKTFVSMPTPQVERFLEQRLLLEPAGAGRSNMQRDYRRPLTILAALVALVLLIACANVANLLSAQTASRLREMAVRVSMGAGRSRLVQLVTVECFWLGSLSALFGGIIAWRAAPFVAAMIDPTDPPNLPMDIDWRVFEFASALTFAVILLLALAPALRAFGIQPVSGLRGGNDPHTRRRLAPTLIAAQSAFCFLILFTGGLFVSTFDRMSNQNLGFSSERLLNLETVTHRPQPPAYWEQVAAHLRAIPGVEAVGITGWPALSGQSAVRYVSINGGPPNEAICDLLSVSPEWRATMKIQLLAGRDFRHGETAPSVAIVNEAFSKKYFGGENPTGKLFEFAVGAARSRVKIVGYTRDARSRELHQSIRPTAYVPWATFSKGALLSRGRSTIVVRTTNTDPLALASILRQEVPRARSEFRVDNIRTQIAINRSNTLRERLLAVLALFFASVALLLAGIGLYGVLNYSVHQRRREIGIRIAIGARASNIVRQVTLTSGAMVLIGAVAGLGLGLASARYIESLLYEVKAGSLASLAVPSLTLFVAVLLAALPAVIRAVRIDPVEMLRAE